METSQEMAMVFRALICLGFVSVQEMAMVFRALICLGFASVQEPELNGFTPVKHPGTGWER